jgi:hypothetical protein
MTVYHCYLLACAVGVASMVLPPSHLPARSSCVLEMAVPRLPTAVSTARGGEGEGRGDNVRRERRGNVTRQSAIRCSATQCSTIQCSAVEHN